MFVCVFVLCCVCSPKKMSRSRSTTMATATTAAAVPYNHNHNSGTQRGLLPNTSSTFTSFLVRSLDRNDQELASVQNINTRLQILKENLETRNPLLLLELGRGRIRLDTATVHADTTDSQQPSQSQQQQQQQQPSSPDRTASTFVEPTTPIVSSERPAVLSSPNSNNNINNNNNINSSGIIVDRLIGTTESSLRQVEDMEQERQHVYEENDNKTNHNNDNNDADSAATTTNALIPIYDVAVSFLLHFKLRRRLLNRLSRRLLRVAHAMDTMKVPEVPTLPSYGDLRLHVDPKAVQALEQVRQEQERILLQNRQRNLHVLQAMTTPASFSYSSSSSETTTSQQQQQQEPKSEGVPSAPPPAPPATTSSKTPNQNLELLPLVRDSSTLESHKEEEDADMEEATAAEPEEEEDDDDDQEAMESEADGKKNLASEHKRQQVLAACLPRLEYQAFLEYKDTYEKQVAVLRHKGARPSNGKMVPPLGDSNEPQYTTLQNNDDKSTTYNNKSSSVEDSKEDYERIPLGSGGIGASATFRSIQTASELEAEFNRWKTALLSKIPDQPRLFAEPVVFQYKKRRAQILQQKHQKEQQKAEKKKKEEETVKQERSSSSIKPNIAVGGKNLKSMMKEKKKEKDEEIKHVKKEDKDDDDDDEREEVPVSPTKVINGGGKSLRRVSAVVVEVDNLGKTFKEEERDVSGTTLSMPEDMEVENLVIVKEPETTTRKEEQANTTPTDMDVDKDEETNELEEKNVEQSNNDDQEMEDVKDAAEEGAPQTSCVEQNEQLGTEDYDDAKEQKEVTVSKVSNKEEESLTDDKETKNKVVEEMDEECAKGDDRDDSGAAPPTTTTESTKAKAVETIVTKDEELEQDHSACVDDKNDIDIDSAKITSANEQKEEEGVQKKVSGETKDTTVAADGHNKDGTAKNDTEAGTNLEATQGSETFKTDNEEEIIVKKKEEEEESDEKEESIESEEAAAEENKEEKEQMEIIQDPDERQNQEQKDRETSAESIPKEDADFANDPRRCDPDGNDENSEETKEDEEDQEDDTDGQNEEENETSDTAIEDMDIEDMDAVGKGTAEEMDTDNGQGKEEDEEKEDTGAEEEDTDDGQGIEEDEDTVDTVAEDTDGQRKEKDEEKEDASVEAKDTDGHGKDEEKEKEDTATEEKDTGGQGKDEKLVEHQDVKTILDDDEEKAADPKENAAEEEDDDDDLEDPVKRLKRPILLLPTPSFYDQDLKRIKLIHAELMSTSIREHARKRMEEVTLDYNTGKVLPLVDFIWTDSCLTTICVSRVTALRTSNSLFERRQSLQAQLQEMVTENRTYVNQMNSDYQVKLAVA